MNWDAIGAVGEILGAAAVVITLVYLSVQLRQNTKALHSTVTHSAHDQTTGAYRALSMEESLADIFVRGVRDPESLTDTEIVRFFAYWHAAVLPMQNWYYQWREGNLDEAFFSSWCTAIANVGQTPGFREFWRQRRSYFSSDFSEFLDSEVLAGESDEDYRPLGARN
jgi:hypothetical protein